MALNKYSLFNFFFLDYCKIKLLNKYYYESKYTKQSNSKNINPLLKKYDTIFNIVFTDCFKQSRDM
jgi:hypothetical protein